MLVSFTLSLCFALLCRGYQSIPAHNQTSSTSLPVSVTLGTTIYTNKGLVGFGFLKSDFRETTGDTLGGIGSGIDIKYGSWKRVSDQTYLGTFVVTPDRGYNVEKPIDYQSRQHEINFVFTPYYGSQPLDFSESQKTLVLMYKNTTLRLERDNQRTTGLDATAVRTAQIGYPEIVTADPEVPIASTSKPRLTIDAEGIVYNADGTAWVSDEYGPYIYHFSADGNLIQTIQPPDAILPRGKHGALNFTSEDDPKTGRSTNQGFEGLTMDHTNQILYAMLQSATIQDGGDSRETSRYTRLLAYDVSVPSIRPRLVGEWIVPLPLSSKGNTQECSEIHFVSPGVFFALSRDGDGRGGKDASSKYKNADLFSILGATDIHGTKYDNPAHPVAPNGKLDKSITPATYIPFVSFIEPEGLERLGLHNDKPNDERLINAKWESLVLASANDPAFPDDFFLFTASDNDFLTKNGVSLGKKYDAGQNVDNQFLVFRVTLPGGTKYHV